MHCEIPYDDLIKILDKNAISAYFVKRSITNVEQSFIIDIFFRNSVHFLHVIKNVRRDRSLDGPQLQLHLLLLGKASIARNIDVTFYQQAQTCQGINIKETLKLNYF